MGNNTIILSIIQLLPSNNTWNPWLINLLIDNKLKSNLGTYKQSFNTAFTPISSKIIGILPIPEALILVLLL